MLEEREEDTLKVAEEKFALWRARQKKRKPIPPELLTLIPALSKTYPLSRLAKALRVNYYTLKKAAMGGAARIERSRGLKSGIKETATSFVEVPLFPSPESRMAAMEVETPMGMKVRVTAGHDPDDRMEEWLKRVLGGQG